MRCFQCFQIVDVVMLFQPRASSYSPAFERVQKCIDTLDMATVQFETLCITVCGLIKQMELRLTHQFGKGAALSSV